MRTIVLALLALGLAIFCVYRLTHHPAPVQAPVATNPNDIAIANAHRLTDAIWAYAKDHEGHLPESVGTLIETGYLKAAPPNPFGTGRMHQIKSLKEDADLAGNYLYFTGTEEIMNGVVVQTTREEFMVVVFGDAKPENATGWGPDFWGFNLPEAVASRILTCDGGLAASGPKLSGGRTFRGADLAKCIAAAGVELPEGALDKK